MDRSLTDFGEFQPQIVNALSDCDAIVLESNYDPDLLRSGPYPWALKERILGSAGHAANPDVAAYLSRQLPSKCRTVVLAHLSRRNNHPELALQAAEEALGRGGRRGVRVALLAKDDYGSYIAFGISTMFGVQALVNLAVAMAILPTKGLTLPFVGGALGAWIGYNKAAAKAAARSPSTSRASRR